MKAGLGGVVAACLVLLVFFRWCVPLLVDTDAVV